MKCLEEEEMELRMITPLLYEERWDRFWGANVCACDSFAAGTVLASAIV